MCPACEGGEQPFWDATSKRWTDAGALVPGQATTTSPDSVQHSVVAVENRTGSELMVNLTVADTHTYYVLAGETPVLVHNCGTGNRPPNLTPDGAGRGIQSSEA